MGVDVRQRLSAMLLWIIVLVTPAAAVKAPVFVTAASLNHLCPLLELLESIHRFAPANPVIVVTLDSKPPHIEEHWLTQVHPRVELRRFKYAEYPTHFNVSVHAGQYAWKPIIIRAIVDEFGRAMWVDSGNRLTASFSDDQFDKLLGRDGFFSPTSPGNPWQWVHMGMMAYFGLAKCCDETLAHTKPCCCCSEMASSSQRCHECPALVGRPQLQMTRPSEWLDKTMCNGALIGFSRDGPAYDRVLVPWWECALDPSCIAPVYGAGRGSVATRGNHRQDQAGLTMLAHFANMSCTGDARDASFSLHNDKRNDNQLCQRLRSSAGFRDDVIPEHDRNPLRR